MPPALPPGRPHPAALWVQDRVMPGCEGAGSWQPWEKGLQNRRRQTWVRASPGAQTPVYFMCTDVKRKTERLTETEQAMGAQTGRVSC